MKRFLVMGVLALGLLAVPRQQASAWWKANFSVGLNWTIESGNNSWLWGAFRNGQVPGYPTDIPCGFGCSPTAPYPYGNPFGGGPGGGPGFDAGYGGGPGPITSYGAPVPATGPGAPPPNQAPPMPAPNGGGEKAPQTTYQGYNGYQPVSYQYQAPSYQNTGDYGAGYYQPSAYYGNYNVPSYWYGNN